MTVINTNTASLSGQNNLKRSQSALGTAMERLSSGLRVNSAKDDAAGQSIANRMTSQIRGSTVAQRNANDGISMSQTAHEVLSRLNDKLQRIRELTIQGINGTLGQPDQDNIQAEINLNLKEIDRLNEQAQFNSIPLLSGQAGMVNLQVGANAKETLGLDLRPPGFSVEALGLEDFNISGISGEVRPTSTLPGRSKNIHLFPTDGTSTSTHFAVSGGGSISDGKLMRSTSDAYYMQGVDAQGNTVHYQADVRAQSYTSTRSTTVSVTGQQETRLSPPDGLKPVTLDGAIFVDTDGAPAPGSAQQLVKAGGNYFLSTWQEGERFYYPAQVETTRSADPTYSGALPEVRVRMMDSQPLTATSYEPAEPLAPLPLAEASLAFEGFPADTAPETGELIEVDGDTYLRVANQDDTFAIYSVDAIVTSLDAPGQGDITVRYNALIDADVPADNAFFADGAKITEIEPPSVYTPAGKMLVRGNDTRFYEKDAGTPASYQPATLTLEQDGSGNLAIVADGVARQEASALQTRSVVDTLPGSPVEKVTFDAPGVDGELALVKGEDDRYFLRALQDDGVAFYNVQVDTVMTPDGSVTITATKDGDTPIRQVENVEIIDSGHSTVEFNADQENLLVSYRDASGVLRENVLGKDSDGNYIMRVSDDGGSSYKTATLVRVDSLEGHYVSGSGEYLLKTLNGMGEVAIYQRFTYSAITDAGDGQDEVVQLERTPR
ncbi:hypothetical protein R5M92_10435 [Halomonas sp. Bachu 37]|uniref:flagellin N-terminal helical domain-containing protein n=1 Tax=Halomonas kashgarensis TaxID=3084920 RepID=UPI0032175225